MVDSTWNACMFKATSPGQMAKKMNKVRTQLLCKGSKTGDFVKQSCFVFLFSHFYFCIYIIYIYIYIYIYILEDSLIN